MNAGPIRTTTLILSCALVLTVLGGCATSNRGGSRGSLSAATASAADDEDDRRIARKRDADPVIEDFTREKDDFARDDDSHSSISLGGNLQGSGGGSGGSSLEGPTGLQIWLSRSRPAGDAVGDASIFTAAYAIQASGGIRAHLGGFLAWPERGSQTTVSEGVTDFDGFGLDLGARKYVTGDHTLMGLYGLLGARFGYFGWEFRNPVGVDEIESDSLKYIEPYFGLGVSLLQTRMLHLGVNGEWGMRFTGDQTSEGFENDLYRDTGRVRFNLETCVLF